jgi:two-component system, NtrC family, response regulator
MSDPARAKLLVVEDDAGLARQLRWAYDGYEVVIAGDRAAAIEALRAEEPAVVTLDLGLPPDPDGTTEGFATLAEILALKPDTKVIVASGHEARDSAREAIARGAWDFYAKPVDIDTLGLIVARAFHVHALEAENARLAAVGQGDTVLGGIVTADPAMQKVARIVERVAQTDVSLLVLGASRRAKGPFVAINCAAIPETLLESELFGHEKGAFTGAVRTVEGKIEQAQGGTLFLDEIGDVPLPLQVKLLRFLQERVVERIGGRKPIPVDVRIVGATHRDLQAMVAQGGFREDLWYRLAEMVVDLPPLADRAGDAVLLARWFLRRHGPAINPQVKGLAPDAAEAVAAYGWPGNVRELENRIKRAVIMADGRQLTAADLDLAGGGAGEPLNLRAVREIADRRAIGAALTRADGNISATARLLGISRPTLYDLMKSYGLGQ